MESDPLSSSNSVMTINQVRAILPHRYPFLLIDRVDELKNSPLHPSSRVGRRVRCRKNVTVNEPFFPGHFPDRPILPGVIQLECMAQAGILACYDPVHGTDTSNVAIAAIDNAKFRVPVVPGDTMIIECEIIKDRRTIVALRCEIFVDGQMVSECDMLASVGKWE
jgi:3-hydroxyacyl-[acyl-carrier-protein] dehydratase